MRLPSNPLRNRINKKVFSFAHNAVLFFSAIMLIFGVIMILDASAYRANIDRGNQFYFFTRQLIYTVGSLIPAYLIYKWDYRKLSKLIVPALIISIGLLIAVLIPGIGVVKNGASRWISLGFMDLQPAEFIKPIFIVYLSTWLAKDRATYHSWQDALKLGFGKKLLGFASVLGLILILILLEPDLDTVVILGAISFLIFFISSSDIVHTLGSLAVIGIFAGFSVLAGLMESYRFRRIQTFIDLLFKGEISDPRGSGLQILQILIGIGSAGFWGKGFGQSQQRYGYLVENTAFTDSIFAVILEELGWIGGFVMVAAWVFFFFAGLRISNNAPDKQGKLIAFGLTTWLTLQAFMNMAANVGLMPISGIPLPFITYGGSGTLVTICSIALLLNIAKADSKVVESNEKRKLIRKR